ncbi:uncharacterized protein LOC126680669 [Mercurialis annua]|uniref:uncharacterized protein LOC126680669 n=1 Tax=Mercurialis annua TaxID=3986 RepID=UPI0024AE3A6C|nr:uncharacterized protein LOC126680669 [Mercurialis annua]
MNSDHRLTPSERAQVEKWLATEPGLNVRANNKTVYGKLRPDFAPLFTRTSRASYEEARTGAAATELYSGQVYDYYRQCLRLMQLLEQPPRQADGVRRQQQIKQQWQQIQHQWWKLEELRRLRTLKKLQAIKQQAEEDKYRLLTSFLFRDNSFLTPWNWNPENPENRSAQGERIVFEPGSFFTHDKPVTRRCFSYLSA